MIGYIHSQESFGTVDGPGIRYVVFMQGCPMRCLYCHNPDTWQYGCGTKTTVSEILNCYNKNKYYYYKGGITVSGGEPLLQLDFVTELFIEASKQGIHTCIDTSGILFNPGNEIIVNSINKLLKYTDLVLLDIKHINNEKHKELTGFENKNVLAFAEYLDNLHVPVWIRHVLVPGYTDDPDHLFELGSFIGKLNNIKAIDVIPYHTLGVDKYNKLGISYRLKKVSPATSEDTNTARKIIINGYHKSR